MYHTPSLALQDLLELFSQQRQHINHFFDHLDLAQCEKALQACLECKGLLVITGVGKSGIIAEKIAATLMSTGTRAFFLPPTNFLHGDIGVFSKDDLVVMFSKSGESQELLELIPHLKKKGSKILAVVSEEESRVARSADYEVYLPVEKELCPYNLAPTTSTTVQLLFGDLISIALMQGKGFTLEQYAGNHPSGMIGRKITKRVKDLMKKGGELPLCKPDDRLVDVIVELSDKKCGCLLVVSEDQRLLGVFTDGDLRRAIKDEGALAMEGKMSAFMNPYPITVAPEDLAIDAIKKMQEKRYVMTAPVLDEEKVVGIIRMHDIIHEGI